MKVAVGLRRVAAGKRTSGRRAAQIAGYGKTYIIGSFNVHNLSSKNCGIERAQAIAQIIKQSGMDLVALQEVLDDSVLKKIIGHLPHDRWEATKKLEPKPRKGAEALTKDLRGEGYAFIRWYVNILSNMSQITNAEVNLLEFCRREGIKEPELLYTENEVKIEDDKNISYFSRELLDN